MALTSISDLEKPTTDQVTGQTYDDRQIKVSTSLASEITFGCKIGDVLVYRKYKDGHSADASGEFAVIPVHLVLKNAEEAFYYGTDTNNVVSYIESAKAIGVWIGSTFMSVDEGNQPWAGVTYTGLYNTNFTWYVNNGVIEENQNNTNDPWLSEIDGYENQRRIMYCIWDNLDREYDLVDLECLNDEKAQILYNDILSLLRQAGFYGTLAWESGLTRSESIVSLKYEFKRFAIEAVNGRDEGFFGSAIKNEEKVDTIFEEVHDASTTTDKYDDIAKTESTWKSKVEKMNYYVNKNAENIPLTIEYALSYPDESEFGQIYSGDDTTYADKANNENPTYSLSTNAFLYCDNYSTEGTESGDWYLGAKEEMHALMNYEVITTLNLVLDLINADTIDCDNWPNYLTSSQPWYNDNYCYTIYTNYRYVTALDKRVISHVRPLLHLS
jgi:hypothetical protein